MFSYEFYKVLHLTSLVTFFSLISVHLWTTYRSKATAIGAGVATLFILVSGMGLMARLGIGHTEPWPLWILVKMSIWVIAGVGAPIVAKRFAKHGRLYYWFIMCLFVTAAYFAVNKIELS